ncbi:MAG: N-acetylmuramoyl-L-alanine amidase [Thermodesulfovibrionales bacterium]|nr:N-acetylmuramoyl-L-alanine amidase [Thermodesulfovibrionales bacterium]
MQIKKKICGLLLAFGLINFVYGQQENQSPECLNQANEYKNSVFILIDPGHGGPSNNGRTCLSGDPGAPATHNGIEYHEACMTTDLAIRLRDILQGLGLDVGMTRDTNIVQVHADKAREIRDRIREAKENKGDNIKPYFISIHFNSSGNSDANGNFGIYAHSNRTGESVANIVSTAQNTVYVNSQGQPIANTFPQVTLHDNQNNLFDALRENIRFVLGGTLRKERQRGQVSILDVDNLIL